MISELECLCRDFFKEPFLPLAEEPMLSVKWRLSEILETEG